MTPLWQDGAATRQCQDETGASNCGEEVLVRAVRRAQLVWSRRIVSAYAIGSLAHGGFSAHVSDVDLGIVLSDPLLGGDAEAVARLSSEVAASTLPLADRLSVFWGSVGTLSGTVTGGRFPPLDVLDLKQFGRLLAGKDVRSLIRSPALREIVVSGAEFALKHLSSEEVTAQLQSPVALASASTKTLTKRVLYPVRLLYTARTGRIGMNDEAVQYLSTIDDGPAGELARMALRWRLEPPRPGEPAVVGLLRGGLLPLYRMFLADYERRLREYGDLQLTEAYRDWQQRLA